MGMERIGARRTGPPDRMDGNTHNDHARMEKEITLKLTNTALRLARAAGFAAVLGLGTAAALAQPPAAPAPAAPPAAPSSQVPNFLAPPAPKPTGPVDPLPKAEPRFFTATSPTTAAVDAFLKQIWGYDSDRIWRVMAIQKTAAPGVAKVVVFLTDKSPNAKVQSTTFFVTPDGEHAIGDSTGVVPFGPKPFEAVHLLLKDHADGAYRGSASKDLELVEFADLQCPHCKEAQSTVDQIVHDFPKARVVFQLFPLVDIHPSAFKAAAFGVCAQKQGNDAFFKYAVGVFDTQDALTPATEDTVLKAAALRAGLDGDAIAACANTQATKDAVNADIKLAEDANVDQTPMLAVNGRLLPLAGVDYETIRRIIQFQATEDGVDSGATAETLAPKPEQPKLQSLPN
jgi:protein-disulfide isomerase